jgi:hypothetical protein
MWGALQWKLYTPSYMLSRMLFISMVRMEMLAFLRCGPPTGALTLIWYVELS